MTRALAELVSTPCMPPLAKVRAFGARGTLEIASSSSDYKLHSCMLCQRREVVRSSSGLDLDDGLARSVVLPTALLQVALMDTPPVALL